MEFVTFFNKFKINLDFKLIYFFFRVCIFKVFLNESVDFYLYFQCSSNIRIQCDFYNVNYLLEVNFLLIFINNNFNVENFVCLVCNMG